MLYLSHLMIGNKDVQSFDELKALIREAARTERFFQMDVKPSYPDTPDDWEDQLESAFSGLLD